MSDDNKPKLDVLAENALIDAEELAESLDRNFRDSDIAQYQQHGIDLQVGAEAYVTVYDGDNRFMKDLQKKLQRYNRLTSAQARAALNVMRQEKGLANDNSQPKEIKCFNCDAIFQKWDDLMAHKKEAHGSKHEAPAPFTDDNTEAKAVIEVTESKLGLDLSNLPDGRYCAPDQSGKNDYIFLMVKRVRKTHKRDRRYVYGKIITGNEVVVAGTIEVKIWSSDSKELVGEQKPNDVYRGDFEEELQLIMLAPEPWALLFGKLKGHCCICGKTLTDEVSRAIGMGIECEKKDNYFKKVRYTYVGKDRPDPEKADLNDEDYLNGRLRRYVPARLDE